MKKILWKVCGLFQTVKNREEGQGMVEYGLIIALIAVVVVVALTPLGTSIKNLFVGVNTSL